MEVPSHLALQFNKYINKCVEGIKHTEKSDIKMALMRNYIPYLIVTWTHTIHTLLNMVNAIRIDDVP